MKIKDIVVHLRKDPLGPDALWPRPHRFRGDVSEVWAGLVRVIADDGTEGYAGIWGMPTMGGGYSEAVVRHTACEIVGLIKKELVGRDVFDREWLWSQRYVYGWWGHMDTRSVSIVDQAMWDLAGRLTNLPVYKLLGSCREKVPCYASGPYYHDDDDHAILARKSRELGYPAFKIKPGGGPVARVKRIATAVREAVGDDMELMLDGQVRFDFEEAFAIGRHLQELNYKWFEDPVKHTDFYALERLGQRLDIPIAWCDHPGTRFHDLTDWIRRPGGPRILRGDCGKDGLTGLKKLCTVADAFGMKCELHGSGLPNLNVMLSIENCDYFEDCLHGCLDKLDTNLHRRDRKDPLYVDEDGFVHAPPFPGLGPPPDLEALKPKIVETLS